MVMNSARAQDTPSYRPSPTEVEVTMGLSINTSTGRSYQLGLKRMKAFVSKSRIPRKTEKTVMVILLMSGSNGIVYRTIGRNIQAIMNAAKSARRGGSVANITSTIGTHSAMARCVCQLPRTTSIIAYDLYAFVPTHAYEY